MSTYRQIQRKQEIAVIREEARKAFREGKGISTCPYRDMSKFQWVNEYMHQEDMARNMKKVKQREKILSANSIDDIKDYLLGLI